MDAQRTALSRADARASELAEGLRAAGLRVTQSRLLIWGLLRELGGHHTADEVAGHLTGRGQPLPRATVYNVLRELAAAGLIMLADAGPGASRYEAFGQWHHHFVCRTCGGVYDVPCVEGVKPCLTPRLEGAQVDEAQVIFRGLCPGCNQGQTE